MSKKPFYIANQNGSTFDEIQRMIISYKNHHSVAIEGDPGVGKNQAIDFVSHIVGKKVYRIRCTEETMARDIIGGDKLVAERSKMGSLATATKFEPGALYSAMSEGNIAVLDEINQLQPTVQKALNSVFEDDRTLGDIEGHNELEAKEGFGLFITYNPETGIVNRDLETAVRDRFKIFYFEDHPPGLQQRISLLRTGDFTIQDLLASESLKLRGISQNNGKFNFLEKENGCWYDTSTKDKFEPDNVVRYLYYDRKKDSPYISTGSSGEYTVVAKAIVNTFSDLNQIKKEGTDKIRRIVPEVHSLTRINLNRGSPRIVNKLLQDYKKLRDAGYALGIILGDLTQSILDYSVPYSERSYSVGDNLDTLDLVKQVCASNGILSDDLIIKIKKQYEGQTKEALVTDIEERGYSPEIAKRLVAEYTT
jgi:hypothetical protein